MLQFRVGSNYDLDSSSRNFSNLGHHKLARRIVWLVRVRKSYHRETRSQLPTMTLGLLLVDVVKLAKYD